MPKSPTLSPSQLATLLEHGEERTAEVGDVLYRVSDRRYPLIAIVKGEVAIIDAAGNEIVRHGPARFLGELNLLSGQTVFVTAVVTRFLRYIAVDRDAASAAVRGRTAERSPALNLHRPPRSAAAGPGHRPGDRRPALVQCHDADDRVRSRQSPALRLARLGPGGRSPTGAPPRRCRAARPLDRAGCACTGIGRELATREEDGVAVRDRSEIAALHGNDGQLEAVTLTSGERQRFSFLFMFLGARPCTEWLGDVIARDADGFILTGSDTHAANLLETSVPGVFAAGDVRAGSTKRCATAVGEGAMAVQFVHARLAAAT